MPPYSANMRGIMRIVMMVPGFIILSGLALLMVRLLKVRFGEGMFLSVSAVMLLMYLSGMAGNFLIGAAAITVLGAIGLVWNGIICVKEKNGSSGLMAVSPVFWVLAVVVLYGILAFYQAQIQHIDELHLWAAVVKDMLKGNHLIHGSIYGSAGQLYAGAFFQLFFQKLTGYSEQGMYAAAFLMIWIGFLLPYAGAGKVQRKVVWLYSLILFFSLYSLYVYPYKTLYSDLQVVAWAGGLGGWWVMRDRGRKKQNLIVLSVGLLTLFFLKTFVGLLMAVFVILFLFSEKIAEDRRMEDRSFRRKAGALVAVLLAAIIFAAGGLLLLIARGTVPAFFPSSITSLMSGADISMDKVVRSVGAIGNAFLGKRLGRSTRVEIYPFAFIIFLAAVLLVEGWLYKERWKARVRIIYMECVTVIFLLFVTYSYVCLFTYQEAVKVSGIRRYFTSLVMFLFVIVLVLWLRDAAADRLLQAGGLAILIFMVLGVNDKFISEATVFNKYQIAGSEDIQEANKEVKKVVREAGAEKVYFINQSQDTEYPQNIALYVMGDQVNNYLNSPWRFTEDGCEIRIQEFDSPTIEDMPGILAAGGYQYVWIYNADEYLAEELPKVLDMENAESADEPKNVAGTENAGSHGMRSGQLYKVVYEGTEAAGLEFVKQLNPDAEEIEITKQLDSDGKEIEPVKQLNSDGEEVKSAEQQNPDGEETAA